MGKGEARCSPEDDWEKVGYFGCAELHWFLKRDAMHVARMG